MAYTTDPPKKGRLEMDSQTWASEHTGLLVAYVIVSIVVGVINAIVTVVRSGKRYRNHGFSKWKWVLGSVFGIASIMIMMPGSFIYLIAYLAGPNRKMRYRRAPITSSEANRPRCRVYNCLNGRVYVNGTSTTCSSCGGTGYEDGRW